ncbi:hypothetical protein BKI52_34690 [marine bacterium AO1-C]|nr:hypothetical protein BKI52_34690 [marine bacterium AO1-C]
MKIRRIGFGVFLLTIVVILINLNTSASKVKMPNLIDVPLEVAITTLKKSGLDTGKIRLGQGAPEYVVLEQRLNGKKILPGTLINKKEKVELIVPANFHSSIEPLFMPNLVGLSLNEAKALTSGYDLVLKQVIHINKATKHFHRVFRQKPLKRTKIRKGDSVLLWVEKNNKTPSNDLNGALD